MTKPAQTLRVGAVSVATMQNLHAGAPDYRVLAHAPACLYAKEVAQLWGGRMTPIMSAADVTGRLSQGVLVCPATACTGSLVLAPDASSMAW